MPTLTEKLEEAYPKYAYVAHLAPVLYAFAKDEDEVKAVSHVVVTWGIWATPDFWTEFPAPVTTDWFGPLDYVAYIDNPGLVRALCVAARKLTDW